VAAPPLDSPFDMPVTYPGDGKTVVKSSKGRSRPTLNMTTWQKNFIEMNYSNRNYTEIHGRGHMKATRRNSNNIEKQ